MTGRHEEEFPRIVAERGLRQALKYCDPFVARSYFEQYEQMGGTAESKLESAMPFDLHSFHSHAVHGQSTPFHGIGWINLHRRFLCVERILSAWQASVIAIERLSLRSDRKPAQR
jgi:hypothetical protein